MVSSERWIETGLWQFNMYMEEVVRKVNVSVGQGVQERVVSLENCNIADNTSLETGSEEKLCRLLSEFGNVC